MKEKKHIALLIPNTDIILEQDLQSFLGDEYIVHSQRMWLENVTDIAEQDMVKNELPKAISYLKGVTDYHCAIFGCTSASVACGFDSMAEIEKLISQELNCPSITAFGAVLKAMDKRKADDVAVLAPYVTEVMETFMSSLKHFGINTVYNKGYGLVLDTDILKVSPQEIYNFATKEAENFRDKSKLCFISCTNFRAVEVLEKLEAELKIPCISSNSSIIEFIKSLS